MFQTISITLLAFVITSLILALNFNTRSMLSWEDGRFERALVEHEDNPPSSLRPITSRMMRALVESSSVSYRTAFILTQYPALFVMLLCFGLTLHKAGFDHRRQTYGVLIAGFAYPVLCAHFVPNFTWDDLRRAAISSWRNMTYSNASVVFLNSLRTTKIQRMEFAK